MIRRHIHFELLCALAPTGQLSPQEQAELRDHAHNCAKCALRLVELIDLGGELLLALKDRPGRTPTGALDRFQVRALREGIPLHPEVPTSSLAHALSLAATVIVAVLMVAAILPGSSTLKRTFSVETSKHIHSPAASSPIAVPTLARPNITQAHVQHARRPSRRNIQTAGALMETGSVPPLHPFALGQYASLNIVSRMPFYPSFSSATASIQPNELFTLTYLRAASAHGRDLVKFRAADASEIAQLLGDSELGPFRSMNRSELVHPVFTLNARVLGSSMQASRSDLDLDAYLPSANLELKSSAPRFHLPQDAAE